MSRHEKDSDIDAWYRSKARGLTESQLLALALDKALQPDTPTPVLVAWCQLFALGEPRRGE